MDSIKNILQNRVDTIISDSNKSELDLVQEELTRFFIDGGDVKATKIHEDGRLQITVGSSALASQCRLNQIKLLKAINSSLPGVISKLYTITK